MDRGTALDGAPTGLAASRVPELPECPVRIGHASFVLADASWHEEMRGRSRGLLILVESKLPADTVEIVTELIDANEYRVAVEIIADVLDEDEQVLEVKEASLLRDLARAMKLERKCVDCLLRRA